MKVSDEYILFLTLYLQTVTLYLAMLRPRAIPSFTALTASVNSQAMDALRSVLGSLEVIY